MVGFGFGVKSGPLLFSRKDTFFFKKKHLYQAKEFYDKYGGGAIFLARFLPIIRTFAPIIATTWVGHTSSPKPSPTSSDGVGGKILAVLSVDAEHRRTSSL